MKKAIIKTSVDMAAAIGAGCSQYGESEFELTDEFLAELSAVERERLAKYLQNGKIASYRIGRERTLSVLPDATPGQIRAALVAELSDVEAAEKKHDEDKAAQREELRQKILAAPHDKLVNNGGPYGWIWRLSYDLENYNSTDDPEVSALKSRLRSLCNQRNEEHRAFNKQQEEKKQEAEEAKAKRQAEIVEEIRIFAVENIEHLCLAARNDYDVTSDVLDDIADNLADPAFGEVEILTEGTPDYSDAEWEERNAPRPEAFELLGKVVDAVQALKHPTCVKVAVSRIMRYSNDATDHHKRTAVIASITVPDTNIRGRHVVFFAE